MHVLTQNVFLALAKANMYMNYAAPRALHALGDLHNWAEIINAYEALDDATSKEIFQKLIVLRILYFSVPSAIASSTLSLYPTEIWEQLEQAAKRLPGVKGDYLLDRIETWVLKGYECKDCKAKSGDVVIDAGAFTGNTTTYFAQCVGARGKVYAFEPMATSFAFLQENTAHLPQVYAVQAGISNKDGQIYIEEQNSPGASILRQGDVCIEVRTIDAFVQEQAIEKIDFLKMDIEGSEMDALAGAVHTIRKYRPKMAICVYHKPNDIFQIYQRILEIDRHYTFYLKHSSNNLWETVLFCMPSTTAHPYMDYTDQYAQDIAMAHVLRDVYKHVDEQATEYERVDKRSRMLEDQVAYILSTLKTAQS